MEGCRGVVVMGRPRDPKTFHKNCKLNLLNLFTKVVIPGAYDSFRMQKSNMGKVDKICQLYLQPVVKTFSLSRIGRTVVKIRQTRLTLCCAARDEGERELRIISSVSYSFFFFFLV